MIKPIETEYKGYRFRSRLEARWAVFFDACGVNWEYEPEGFDLGDGIYYLPDFVVWNGYGERWFEVKGIMTAQDRLKILKFRESGKNITVLSRIPYGTTAHEVYEDVCNQNKECELFFAYISIELDRDDEYNVIGHHFEFAPELLGTINNIFGSSPCEGHINMMDKKTVRAYKNARQARFEYGK